MLDADTLAFAAQVLASLRGRKRRVVTAESCTGGLIAASLTHHAGASDVVEGGIVTYSNAMKSGILGVSAATLAENGAVSEAVAVEMAFGALGCAPNAGIAIAVTGIAGPDGGSPEKPVGTVCIACQSGTGAPSVETHRFTGDRETIRLTTVRRALEMLAAT